MEVQSRQEPGYALGLEKFSMRNEDMTSFERTRNGQICGQEILYHT